MSSWQPAAAARSRMPESPQCPIYVKPRFTDNSLPVSPVKDGNVRLLHASDLHITESDMHSLTEGGCAFHQATLDAIMNAIAKDAGDCDGILLTGDITDTGALAEWHHFMATCPPEIHDKLILVPGNHDLNLQDSLLAVKAEEMGGANRRHRQLRMIAVMTEMMGNRATVLDRATDRLISLRRYVERQLQTFPTPADAASMSPQLMESVWRTLFPMVVPVGPVRNGKKLEVLILDSVKPGSLGLTNAIGTISDETLEACRTLLNRMSDRCDSFVVALHHHVALAPGGSPRERAQNAGLVLENASVLIDMLAMRGEPTVVFHGHRHRAYAGTATGSNVAVVAAPSASIGKGNALGKGSWRLVDLYCSEDGAWLVEAPRIRSLQGHSQAVPDRSDTPVLAQATDALL